MAKRVLGDAQGKALLVLPYVALVQEKVRYLRAAVQSVCRPKNPHVDETIPAWRRRKEEELLRVVGFFGGGKVRATWADFDVAVCTIEKVILSHCLYGVSVTDTCKANSLINTAIDDGSIPQLKCIVLDELHMIDDAHRGYLLEMIGTKILSLEQDTQIVGMSATLPVS